MIKNRVCVVVPVALRSLAHLGVLVAVGLEAADEERLAGA